MGSNRLTMVVSLHVHPGHESEFEQFESAATQIMRRYGGEIERRIGIAAGADPSLPYEVHVVSFPDEISFQEYRKDSDLQAISELRSRAIRETTIWFGTERPGFKQTGEGS